MPLYDLKCTECGHRFEAEYKLAEVSSAECPKCGKPAETLITCVPPRHFSWGSWKVNS
jgi:putative FmdB family regulatory protein